MYFAYGHVYLSMILSQYVPPSPSATISTSLYVCVSVAALQMDSKASERLCIKTKVTQCQYREARFEPRSGGASFDNIFPSEYPPTCQERDT